MAEERQKNPNDEQLPGNVSNQNSEEQLPDSEEQKPSNRPPSHGRGDGESGGEAKEGSQSTGSPASAG
ncbi:MAG TPA: hypothetical protein VFN87_22930 [Solirubrobacteraceae bacterium]|nr:hypothetical protein [Solirubrobacteraceae bacterium]